MTAVDLQKLTLDAYTDQIVARFSNFGEDFWRLMVPGLRELATGQPVEPERLAALAGVPLEQTISILQEQGVDWEPSGKRLIGGLGLTWIPTSHRFEVQGNTLWAWCAVDALVFPVVIGAPARIQSPCATTGDPITIDVTPTEVQRVEPTDTVVSISIPSVGIADIRGSMCNHTNFYRSAEVAPKWATEDPDGRLLSVFDTFEAFRRAFMRLLGDQLTA